MEPEVSIIISVYNDAQNLKTAIDSVTRQTLKSLEILIIDDCSTDNSYEVASQLASTDERIRVFQTPENSGGAGLPRNIGINRSMGNWLIFLDSDDRLDRHACKNLLRAAKENPVQLVCGQTRRYDVDKARWSGWHSRLYVEPRTINNISEWVELLIDSNSTGKLIKRDFLISNNIWFPTEMHYEDLVFTANIYNQAIGIQVIPEVVYVWKIYPNHIRKSITHQRDSLRGSSQLRV